MRWLVRRDADETSSIFKRFGGWIERREGDATSSRWSGKILGATVTISPIIGIGVAITNGLYSGLLAAFAVSFGSWCLRALFGWADLNHIGTTRRINAYVTHRAPGYAVIKEDVRVLKNEKHNR
jgi:hypothetical protein